MFIKDYLEARKLDKLVANKPTEEVDGNQDGNDAVVPWTTEVFTIPSIPLHGTVKKGDKGNGQLAVKRAMSAADPKNYKWRTRWGKKFDSGAVKELKRLQKKWGIKADGEYGPESHRRLSKYFDSYGRHLMRTWHPAPNKLSIRNQFVKVAMFAHSKAPRHYTQSSLRAQGVYNRIKPPNMWNYADCSAFCLWIAFVVLGYDEARRRFGILDGWTGSMVYYGYRVSVSNILPGDMVFYGSGPSHSHVAIYVGNGKVVTHGHEGGPFFTSMYYRSDVAEIRRYI